LEKVLATLGSDRNKLVIDLSCRKKERTWFVAMDKWQTITEMEITKGSQQVCPSFGSFKTLTATKRVNHYA